MTGTTRLRPLKGFVKRVEEGLDWEFRLSNFDDRVRIQKYVFLAREFGWDHEYRYNLYHHGPYSPALAKDYYEDEFSSVSASDSNLGIDHGRYFEFIEGRGRDWLEVATTLKSIHDKYFDSTDSEFDLENYEWVISRVVELKDVEYSEAEEIYDELAEEGLVVPS